jgi:hypothetical protein
MGPAETWVAFNNALAVGIAIIVIAALFYSLPARVEGAHSLKYQTAHGCEKLKLLQ